MIIYKKLLIVLTLLISNMVAGQDLTKHQWTNRLILVMTQDTTEQIFQNQLAEFNGKDGQLTERKLLIYQVTPTHHRLMPSNMTKWESPSSIFSSYKETTEPFEIILSGLDGGVKFRSTTLTKLDTLFSLIDSMPMRRAEMRRKKQ